MKKVLLASLLLVNSSVSAVLKNALDWASRGEQRGKRAASHQRIKRSLVEGVLFSKDMRQNLCTAVNEAMLSL